MRKRGYVDVENIDLSASMDMVGWVIRKPGAPRVYALSASIPADNGTLLANPASGVESGYGLTSPALLTPAITGVNTGTKTVTVANSEWYGLVAGAQFPHFNASHEWVGVLEVATVASPVVYSVVSGLDPVVGGFIMKHEVDFATHRAKFSWKEIEGTKDVYDFAALELLSGIKVIRALNDHAWGQYKKVILNLILDYPSGSAHRDIPDWLYTETSADGVAYTISNGQGYAPDYTNATLIAAHGRLLAALGEQYADDPIFYAAQLGSLGHYGENWIDSTIHATQPFPDNTVVNQYLGHYASAFGTRCLTRRSIGNSGALGFGLYNHGFYVEDQTTKNEEGGVDGLLLAKTDDFGHAQAAITDFKSRFTSGEPFGTSNGATNDYAFANEPAGPLSQAVLNDPAAWESGLYGQTIGSALSTSANAVHFRLKTANKMDVLPNTVYMVRRRNGVSNTGMGYRCRVYVTDSSNILRQYATVNDRGTFTTPANAAFAVISIDEDQSPQKTMSHAKVLDAFPRIYPDVAAGYAKERNIELLMKWVKDWPLSVFSINPTQWRTVGSNALEANVNRFFKRIGYRLRPTAVSLTDGDLTVTVRNDGCQPPHCGELRLKAGLFSGTTLVWSGQSTERVDTIASDTTANAVVAITYSTPGTYTLAIGLCPAGGTPDIEAPATAVTGKWYGIGTITVT